MHICVSVCLASSVRGQPRWKGVRFKPPAGGTYQTFRVFHIPFGRILLAGGNTLPSCSVKLCKGFSCTAPPGSTQRWGGYVWWCTFKALEPFLPAVRGSIASNYTPIVQLMFSDPTALRSNPSLRVPFTPANAQFQPAGQRIAHANGTDHEGAQNEGGKQQSEPSVNCRCNVNDLLPHTML